MLRNHKIITVTPAGRKRYLEILVPYLLANKHVIDKHRFWVNTNNFNDIQYMESLVEQYPDFFELEYLPEGQTYQGNYSICNFFRNCCEEDVIYIRLDDDVCYIDKGTIEKIANFRLDNPDPFLIYPVIINNCVLMHILQEQNAMSQELGMAGYTCIGKGWQNPKMAHLAHHEFLTALMSGDLSKYTLDDRVFDDYVRISINCICWSGKDFAEFNGEVGGDEEQWLSVDKPKSVGRPNALCGDALIVHFAFHTQRHFLESETNDLLCYRVVSNHINS
jgi:hypothetical protein